MKIYTKTGDDGTTSLANGERVNKNSLRVELYGTVDELNSIIGIIRSTDLDKYLQEAMENLSSLLFTLGSDLSTPFKPEPKWKVERLSTNAVAWLENLIDEYTEKLPELKEFILPGGCISASHIHHARTVCRRAERLAISLAEHEEINKDALLFLNRLSDYLFVSARMSNHLCGYEDIKWDKSINSKF